MAIQGDRIVCSLCFRVVLLIAEGTRIPAHRNKDGERCPGSGQDAAHVDAYRGPLQAGAFLLNRTGTAQTMAKDWRGNELTEGDSVRVDTLGSGIVTGVFGDSIRVRTLNPPQEHDFTPEGIMEMRISKLPHGTVNAPSGSMQRFAVATFRDAETMARASGSVYELESGGNWRTAADDEWSIEVETVDGPVVGQRRIDGALCAIIQSNGRFYGVLKQNVEMAAGPEGAQTMAADQIKRGDRVRVVDSSPGEPGMVGVVISVQGGFADVRRDRDGVVSRDYPVNELVRLSASAEGAQTMAARFKVGDSVYVAAASRLDGPGVVRAVYDDGHYEVEPSDPRVRQETTRLRVAEQYIEPQQPGRAMSGASDAQTMDSRFDGEEVIGKNGERGIITGSAEGTNRVHVTWTSGPRAGRSEAIQIGWMEGRGQPRELSTEPGAQTMADGAGDFRGGDRVGEIAPPHRRGQVVLIDQGMVVVKWTSEGPAREKHEGYPVAEAPAKLKKYGAATAMAQPISVQVGDYVFIPSVPYILKVLRIEGQNVLAESSNHQEHRFPVSEIRRNTGPAHGPEEGWPSAGEPGYEPWGGFSATTMAGGPFYQGAPGNCPRCGVPSEVIARGQGGWTEMRRCHNGHEFTVEFQSSNDPGTVTEMGRRTTAMAARIPGTEGFPQDVIDRAREWVSENTDLDGPAWERKVVEVCRDLAGIDCENDRAERQGRPAWGGGGIGGRHGFTQTMARWKRGDHVLVDRGMRAGELAIVIDAFPSPNAPGGDSVTVELDDGSHLTLPARDVSDATPFSATTMSRTLISKRGPMSRREVRQALYEVDEQDAARASVRIGAARYEGTVREVRQALFREPERGGPHGDEDAKQDAEIVVTMSSSGATTMAAGPPRVGDIVSWREDLGGAESGPQAPEVVSGPVKAVRPDAVLVESHRDGRDIWVPLRNVTRLSAVGASTMAIDWSQIHPFTGPHPGSTLRSRYGGKQWVVDKIGDGFVTLWDGGQTWTTIPKEQAEAEYTVVTYGGQAGARSGALRMALDASTLREGDRVEFIEPSGFAGQRGTVRVDPATSSLAIFLDDGRGRVGIQRDLNNVMRKLSANTGSALVTRRGVVAHVVRRYAVGTEAWLQVRTKGGETLSWPEAEAFTITSASTPFAAAVACPLCHGTGMEMATAESGNRGRGIRCRGCNGDRLVDPARAERIRSSFGLGAAPTLHAHLLAAPALATCPECHKQVAVQGGRYAVHDNGEERGFNCPESGKPVARRPVGYAAPSGTALARSDSTFADLARRHGAISIDESGPVVGAKFPTRAAADAFADDVQAGIGRRPRVEASPMRPDWFWAQIRLSRMPDAPRAASRPRPAGRRRK